jgi:hypothetical protein
LNTAANTTITPTLVTIEEGLSFILSHFPDGLRFPRTISTHATEGRQVLVYSEAEALGWYKAANLLDRRISGYPDYTEYYANRTGISPDLLHVDLDKSLFRAPELFETASTKVIQNFKEMLCSQPTMLWSGGGSSLHSTPKCDSP